jgi:hypothetical protein
MEKIISVQLTEREAIIFCSMYSLGSFALAGDLETFAEVLENYMIGFGKFSPVEQATVAAKVAELMESISEETTKPLGIRRIDTPNSATDLVNSIIEARKNR